MRKFVLRIAGLTLVLGALLGVAPVRQAAAQPPCACILDCHFGSKCCVRLVNGVCEQSCIPVGQTCNP
jgi:hypothetical protein